MNAVKIIGCTVGGALAGFVGGVWYGDRKYNDDFGMGAFISGMSGAFVGGLAGVVAGSALFA